MEKKAKFIPDTELYTHAMQKDLQALQNPLDLYLPKMPILAFWVNSAISSPVFVSM